LIYEIDDRDRYQAPDIVVEEIQLDFDVTPINETLINGVSLHMYNKKIGHADQCVIKTASIRMTLLLFYIVFDVKLDHHYDKRMNYKCIIQNQIYNTEISNI